MQIEQLASQRRSPSVSPPAQNTEPALAQPSEVWIESPKGVGFRRTLSRRFNKSIRQSWSSSRRNSALEEIPDEEEPEPSSPSSLEKVKKASKRRDWSDELDEDDIYL